MRSVRLKDWQTMSVGFVDGAMESVRSLGCHMESLGVTNGTHVAIRLSYGPTWYIGLADGYIRSVDLRDDT